MTRLFALLLLVVWMPLSAQDTARALFIGNSYTYYNTMPDMVSFIARSMGDSLYTESSTPGGYTLQSHTTNANTQAKLRAGGWDYVILQDQSQRPSFPPSQVATDVLPYAKMLVDTARAYNSCVSPIFYMTWGRKNGDASNCPSYPPLCTYAGMQARLRSSYLLMAQQNNASVSPVGAVWRETRSANAMELYTSDESHPSLAGSYLAACTFYASIFHKSPVGAWSPSALNASDVAFIQGQVETTVFDSLSTWMIDTTSIIPDENHFISHSTATTCYITVDCSGTQNADSIYMDFGNGTTSSAFVDTVGYTIYQDYILRIEYFRACESVVVWDTIYAQELCGVGQEEVQKRMVLYPNPAKEFVQLATFNIDLNGAQIEVIDNAGIVRKSVTYHDENISVGDLPSGVYVLRIVKGEEEYVFRFEKE